MCGLRRRIFRRRLLWLRLCWVGIISYWFEKFVGGLASATSKLNSSMTEGTFDRSTRMLLPWCMDCAIAFVTQSNAFGLTIDSGRGIIAMFAEWKGSNGRSEINPLMVCWKWVLFNIAFGA